MNDGLPGVAGALARAEYEAALKGHIILNEIEIDEFNSILTRTAVWMENRYKGGSRKDPPKIDQDRHRWRWVVGTIGGAQGYVRGLYRIVPTRKIAKNRRQIDIRPSPRSAAAREGSGYQRQPAVSLSSSLLHCHSHSRRCHIGCRKPPEADTTRLRYC